MRSLVICVLVALSWSTAGIAEVLIELHDRPFDMTSLVSDDEHPATGGLATAPRKANQPLQGQWFVPYFRADKQTDGDSTFFAIRSEGALPSPVVAEFFDVHSQVQTTETYDLDPREVRTVAVKHVPNLAVGGDGYARGFLKITSLVPITVDYFQLETRNDFAVGGVGFVVGDFCTRWSARFLRFGASGGTTLSMMINGPQGTSPADPVTVAGNVFTESGDPVGSFSIRTDEWALQLPVHELVPEGLDFGVVELIINSTFLPAGIVEVQHQTFGRFSVGHWAICMD